MRFYWSVSGPKVYSKADDTRPCTEYTPHRKEITGSLEIAHELEDLSVEEAMVFLDDFYEKVWFNGSDYHPRVICFGPFDYDPESDYSPELATEEGIEFDEDENEGIVFEGDEEEDG